MHSHECVFQISRALWLQVICLCILFYFFSALVLEVQSDLVCGGKLAVNKPVESYEDDKQVKVPEGSNIKNVALITGDAPRETL